MITDRRQIPLAGVWRRFCRCFMPPGGGDLDAEWGRLASGCPQLARLQFGLNRTPGVNENGIRALVVRPADSVFHSYLAVIVVTLVGKRAKIQGIRTRVRVRKLACAGYPATNTRLIGDPPPAKVEVKEIVTEIALVVTVIICCRSHWLNSRRSHSVSQIGQGKTGSGVLPVSCIQQQPFP